MTDEPFVWKSEQQLAFETMAIALTTEPIVQHFDHERTVIIDIDASNNISAGDLPQYDDDSIFHPLAYCSKKDTPAKYNNNIYDDEPMAIIKAFKEWSPKRGGATYPLQLITDYKNLEYIMTKKLLNQRQVW